MFSQGNLIRILINTSLGVLLIFFWLKLVNVNLILEELRKVNLLETLPFFLIFLLSGALRAFRLKLLLKKYAKIPLKNVIPLTYLGQLLSFTIPLRIGELAKGIYLSSEFKLDTARVVIWIFLDRFIDFWAVLVFALVLLLFIPTNLPANFVFILLLAIGGMSLLVSLIIFAPNLVKKIIELISKILVFPVLQKYFHKISIFLVDSAAFLNQGRVTVGAILITFLTLICDSLGWVLLFLVVFKEINFLPILLGSLLSMLTYLVPAAPGYVGSAEASGVAVFSLGLGYDKTLVSVITLLFHALTLIAILGTGLISLYLLKFDLSLVWKKFKK